MSDFYIRTEDISNEDLLGLFVETDRDRQIINALKSQVPTVLVGSRGVGKSFLLKVAAAEQKRDLATTGAFPVYVSFTKSSLVQFSKPEQFQWWMLAKLCNSVFRALAKEGLLIKAPKQLSILAGGNAAGSSSRSQLEEVEEAFELSWRNPDQQIDVSAVPDVDSFREAIEDVCGELKLSRISLFIDEAAHVFLPQQQRSFFTLFRDLRTSFLTCNAAIYPGVTSYGETFQKAHDANFISVERDPLSSDYGRNMREIVERQADSNTQREIAKNGQLFAVLAYAASGNPRLLLKTIINAKTINSTAINEVVRTFYRQEIWAEHSLLAEKYPGHKHLIDWGRRFVEDVVLSDLQKKNSQSLVTDKSTSCFFWVHRDAPMAVKHALQILAYTGVVSEHSLGIKATRAEVGTRYSVNLGCLFALESLPSQTAFAISQALSVKRMTEFGSNHSSYLDLGTNDGTLENSAVNREALMQQLGKDISVLDISGWQKSKLRELELNTVGNVLKATEQDLKKAEYVGNVRARQMRNAAEAAVFEYLSG
ncbi:MAG: hypothetical protein V4706_13985 [Pseudomonadota bacterium]